MVLYRLQNKGFSLTEVLMAAGILAIGFAFIAGMFPVGVRLTAIATEQTIAPIVTDEAIAKIKLYGVDPNALSYYNRELFNKDILPNDVLAQLRIKYVDDILIDEFFEEESLYPSTDMPLETRRYNWSALCRRFNQRNVDVIVFVSRKSGAGSNYVYYDQSNTLQTDGFRAVPVKVQVNQLGPRKLSIIDPSERAYINAGCTIVDDAAGSFYGPVYRVLQRNADGVVTLDREWRNWEVLSGDFVWVVPPAQGSGMNPCIGVYQTVIGF